VQAEAGWRTIGPPEPSDARVPGARAQGAAALRRTTVSGTGGRRRDCGGGNAVFCSFEKGCGGIW